MYTFIGILLYSTKFYFINILRISSLRVSRKSLPRCERHFTKISIRLVFIIFSSPFLSFAEFRRERERKKTTDSTSSYSHLKSLYEYYADLNSEEQLKELKIACLIRFLIQSRFRLHSFAPPFFPSSSKLFFGMNDLESRISRRIRTLLVAGSRTRGWGRRTGISLARATPRRSAR